MTVRTLTALFSNRADAMDAVAELESAGIPRSAIRVLPESDTTAGTSAYDHDSDSKGFWASLGDFLFPDEDRYSYAEAMHRGDIMVTATVEEPMLSTAEDILDEDGALRIEDREDAWRKEGWQGYRAEDSQARSDTGSAEVIPLAEEELRVGKREVGRGRVRVRSYVVEEPVTASVDLREESVHVDRRPVDRAVTGSDADRLFQERTIEVEERAEEPVIDKAARIREEVAIGKTVEQRTEQVSDTVRRTEVEVEDDRQERKRKAR